MWQLVILFEDKRKGFQPAQTLAEMKATIESQFASLRRVEWILSYQDQDGEYLTVDQAQQYIEILNNPKKVNILCKPHIFNSIQRQNARQNQSREDDNEEDDDKQDDDKEDEYNEGDEGEDGECYQQQCGAITRTQSQQSEGMPTQQNALKHQGSDVEPQRAQSFLKKKTLEENINVSQPVQQQAQYRGGNEKLKSLKSQQNAGEKKSFSEEQYLQLKKENHCLKNQLTRAKESLRASQRSRSQAQTCFFCQKDSIPLERKYRFFPHIKICNECHGNFTIAFKVIE